MRNGRARCEGQCRTCGLKAARDRSGREGGGERGKMNQRTKLRKLLEEERRLSAQIHAQRISDFAKARARQGREQGDPLAGTKALVAAQTCALHARDPRLSVVAAITVRSAICVAEIRRLLLERVGSPTFVGRDPRAASNRSHAHAVEDLRRRDNGQTAKMTGRRGGTAE